LSNPAETHSANSPLELTVHTLPDPVAQQRAGRLRMLLVVAVCAAPVIASYFSFYVLKLQGRPNGELITPPVELPLNLHLSDLQGHAVAAASLKGQWLLTLVQGGACSADCEKRLYEQRQLREMLGKDRDKVDKLWLVPDDAPLRPELQQALERAVPPTILRLPRAELEAWLRPAAGHALEESFFVIDPMGRWMLRSLPDAEPKAIKQDMDRLLKANAGWDRPGR
jgi:hypothetical protein